jgi:hypothetical protein
MTEVREHARYADWDAAYVLGSLSPVERREYEGHLETCDRCRLAVADLSGLRGLLGRIDADRAFSLLDEESPAPVAGPVPADLVERIERAEHRRRARRIGLIAGIAAAVLVAGAVVVPLTISAQSHPTVAVALQPTEASPLSADVDLTSVKWGTRIDMHCAYAEGDAWQDPAAEGDWSFALWVIDKAGHASQVSTWKALSGVQIKLTAATALPIDQIARVQVRSASNGAVLLTKKL